MKKCKLLLFDLDGTLLQSDKTISTRTLSALKKCRENDILIGVSTSRSEQNSLVFLNELMPDILISSGGALVKYKTEYIYRAEFSEEETNVIIAFGDDYADIGMLELCGTGVAMGNAIDEVKERADIVIGSNDEDGIAGFIANEIL